MLEEGVEAPAFELPDQHGDTVALSDYAGERVVLYFYPKANTPGCTNQACAFRDSLAEFEDLGIEVVGLSTDPVEDIAAFAEEYDLTFPLLSDEDGEVASAYDTFGTVEKGGRTFDIAFRNTYVVGPDGTIEAVYEDVSPEDHADVLLADLAA